LVSGHVRILLHPESRDRTEECAGAWDPQNMANASAFVRSARLCPDMAMTMTDVALEYLLIFKRSGGRMAFVETGINRE